MSFRGLVLGLAFLLAAPLYGQGNVEWSRSAVGQMRFLYGLPTEFSGCLYGNQHGDTIHISFFISGVVDPRLATDSTVPQGACPLLQHSTLVAIAHSHIRRGSLCVPSGKDMNVLRDWQRFHVRLGVILCAAGDTLALYSENGFGLFAVPPLDSLYAR